MGREFFSTQSQMLSFLLSIFLGVCVGVFYDVFRILRLSLSTHKIVVLVQDILFWLFTAVASFLFVFVVNNGEFRFYFVFGELVGFAVYYFTMGAAVMKITQWLVKIIRKIFRGVFRILLFPFKKIFLVFSPKITNMCKTAKKTTKNSSNKFKFSLKRSRVMMYNRRSKKNENE